MSVSWVQSEAEGNLKFGLFSHVVEAEGETCDQVRQKRRGGGTLGKREETNNQRIKGGNISKSILRCRRDGVMA